MLSQLPWRHSFPEREVPGMDEIPVEKSATDKFNLDDFDNLTISTRVVHLIQEPAEPQTDSDVEKDIALFFGDDQMTKNPMYTDEEESKSHASRASRVSAMQSLGENEEKELDYPIVMVDDEAFSVISETENRLVIQRINPAFLRSRFQNSTTALPQDLYETPLSCLVLLAPLLETLKGLIFFEPCHGGGAITTYA